MLKTCKSLFTDEFWLKACKLGLNVTKCFTYMFLLNVTRAKQKNEHLNSIGREQKSWQGHFYLPFILRKETIVIIKMSSAADSSINTASFKGIRWYQEWCLKTNSYFFIFNHLLTAGLPRLARPPRPGTCLDFGFQYAHIRNNRSKKIGVRYWTLPGSNLPWWPF